MTVAFRADGSNDLDGTVETYAWDFGDGTTASDPNPAHTYLTAGTYVATLTVTDNRGATDSDRVTITVAPNPTGEPSLRSTAIELSTSHAFVIGRVSIANETGAQIEGATVHATWTRPDGGILTQTATSQSNGEALFVIRGGSGAYTLMITDITKADYVFDPANSVLSERITK
ncbi:MAG: PKD domain-containing protein [Chloroflexales bacterium]|nr:PKD domain-containing protein [Chloroflexales bacterium]